jgi:prevent-host-death family protein
MARYKRFGNMLVVEPQPKAVEEVTVTDLSRDTSAVLARVRAGRRAIVTKHGEPVAVLMEVDEAVGLCGTVLLSRQDAERRMFGDLLEAEVRYRRVSRQPRIFGGE